MLAQLEVGRASSRRVPQRRCSVGAQGDVDLIRANVPEGPSFINARRWVYTSGIVIITELSAPAIIPENLG